MVFGMVSVCATLKPLVLLINTPLHHRSMPGGVRLRHVSERSGQATVGGDFNVLQDSRTICPAAC